MKLAVTLVLLILSQTAFADEQCMMSDDDIGATYSIQSTDAKNSGKNKDYQLTLWRSGNNVAHTNNINNITVLWHRVADGRTKETRIFEDYGRGIEYELSVSRSDQRWQSRTQLINDHSLQAMELVGSTGEGCETIEHYRQVEDGNNVNIWWQPALSLVTKFSQHKRFTTTVWNLEDKTLDKMKVDSEFSRLRSLHTDDFTDVGDNESDPFLAKMINLGFVEHGASGVYDSNGNSDGGKHQH